MIRIPEYLERHKPSGVVEAVVPTVPAQRRLARSGVR